MTLLDEVVGARHARSQPATSAVAEIADALLEMGGSAHRDAVIDRVATRRGEMAVSEGLRFELIEAFDGHCAARTGRPALFHLPFGEGSRRWSLTREVMLSVTEQPAPTVALLLPAGLTSCPGGETAEPQRMKA
jgi:hypothetical protein